LWKVASYKQDIAIGDTVYMWGGPNATLLARCSVSSKARLQPADTKYAPHMLHPKYLEDMWHARLRVERTFAMPISRQELLKHPVLASQLPIGGAPSARQGTNFSVHPDAAQLLDRFTRDRGQLS
jgi:hypothetical protein